MPTTDRKPLAARLPLPVQAATVRAAAALPRLARRALAGKPIVIDGQRLALDAQVLLTLNRLADRGLSVDDVAQSRADIEDSTKLIADKTLTSVATRAVRIPTADGDLDARLYLPDGPATTEEPAPLLLFLHGGGWVIGSLDTHDDAARFMALHAGVRVLSVAYRLAPEHPFPAAVNDGIAAFDFAHSHAAELGIDPARIAIGGDSAGGNLSAVVSHQTTRRGGPAPAFQVLIYPATDFTTPSRSRSLFADGFFLTKRDMDWFEAHYLPDGAAKADPRASILLADDLIGLPPAYLVTAGFDPLRDEGEAYAAALQKAGVPVVLRRQEDLIHGFINFVAIGRRFREATLEIASAVRTGLELARK